MNGIVNGADQRVHDVQVNADILAVVLMNGRRISVPLVWFPRLLDTTPEQRALWESAGAGHGIHQPDLDEDLSTEGLLRGVPAASAQP